MSGSEQAFCPRCGLRPVKMRRNGRPLPACSECWGDGLPVGTRSTTDHGYVRVKTERGWEFEHHVVAEQVLGRKLHPDEHLGWDDGDRSNNTPENLVLAVTRTRPLVEAPKRKRTRAGEKHPPRTEIRLHPMIREHIERMLPEGQTFATTVAALATSAVLDELPEDDRLAYFRTIIADYERSQTRP